eukprot:scaffold12805_cov108-Isochrysis_galbana.AAC.3
MAAASCIHPSHREFGVTSGRPRVVGFFDCVAHADLLDRASVAISLSCACLWVDSLLDRASVALSLSCACLWVDSLLDRASVALSLSCAAACDSGLNSDRLSRGQTQLAMPVPQPGGGGGGLGCGKPTLGASPPAPASLRGFGLRVRSHGSCNPHLSPPCAGVSARPAQGPYCSISPFPQGTTPFLHPPAPTHPPFPPQVQGPYCSISAFDRADDYDEYAVCIAYVFVHPRGLSLSSNGRVFRSGDILKAGEQLPTQQVRASPQSTVLLSIFDGHLTLTAPLLPLSSTPAGARVLPAHPQEGPGVARHAHLRPVRLVESPAAPRHATRQRLRAARHHRALHQHHNHLHREWAARGRDHLPAPAAEGLRAIRSPQPARKGQGEGGELRAAAHLMESRGPCCGIRQRGAGAGSAASGARLDD